MTAQPQSAADERAVHGRARAWAARLSWTTGSSLVEFGFRLLRTIVLSHLLSPTEFGVAVAIMSVVVTMELATDVGLDKIVVFYAGDRARNIRGAAQVLQLARGALLALAIVLLAPYLARFFGTPQYSASFAMAGALPIVRAFAHLGVKEALRDHDYRPDSLAVMTAQAAALLATYAAAAWWFQDHRAMLAGFGVEYLVYTFLTHLLSPVRLQMMANMQSLKVVLRYGLPLALNGIALAILSQVDRLMVGSFIGVDALGRYAVILTVAIAPTAIVGRSFAVPAGIMLARTSNEPEKLRDVYVRITWIFATIGLAYAVAIGLLLDTVVPLVFGASNQVEPDVRLLMVAIVFMRIYRLPPNGLLVTTGDTTRLLLANFTAVSGLVVAVLLCLNHPGFTSVLTGVLAGEIVTFVSLQSCVISRLRTDPWPLWQGPALSAAMLAVVLMLLAAWPANTLSTRLFLAAACLVPVGALAAMAVPAIRSRLRQFI